MSETNVGGIKGTLSLDLDDWDASIDKAKADVAGLKSSSADVKVTADTSRVAEQLTAVEATVKELDAQSATVTVKLSETGSLGGGAAGIAAETAAQDAATSSIQEQTAAKTANTAAQDANNESVFSSIAENKAQAAAIAAVTLAAAPLSGAIVGLGSALVAEGAAGALAVYGISQALKDGTETGMAYRSALDSLKGDLDGLASTAAVGMLGEFQQAEQTISADMPALNNDVGVFVSYLGQTGNELLEGALQAVPGPQPADGRRCPVRRARGLWSGPLRRLVGLPGVRAVRRGGVAAGRGAS